MGVPGYSPQLLRVSISSTHIVAYTSPGAWRYLVVGWGLSVGAMFRLENELEMVEKCYSWLCFRAFLFSAAAR